MMRERQTNYNLPSVSANYTRRTRKSCPTVSRRDHPTMQNKDPFSKVKNDVCLHLHQNDRHVACDKEHTELTPFKGLQ
jgi:hypothetical protein